MLQKFILANTKKHAHDLVAFCAQSKKVSRTTVLRHIAHLVKAGKLCKSGATKQMTYSLANAIKIQHTLTINDQFEEFAVFDRLIKPSIHAKISQNAFDVAEYVITELLNNCKDHSRSTTATVKLELTSEKLIVDIIDKGVGVFATLAPLTNSNDPRDIIVELSLGKLTRDPNNHTGEGLFFSARATDVFMLSANGFCYMRDNKQADWSFAAVPNELGTNIHFELDKDYDKSLVALFKRYQNDESLAFEKTDLMVALAKLHGERLISRSQAKRICHNLDQFKHITLDFKGVAMIGQGFADQLFRVYQQQHPELQIAVINASDDILFMIKRSVVTVHK